MSRQEVDLEHRRLRRILGGERLDHARSCGRIQRRRRELAQAVEVKRERQGASDQATDHLLVDVDEHARGQHAVDQHLGVNVGVVT